MEITDIMLLVVLSTMTIFLIAGVVIEVVDFIKDIKNR